MHHTESEQPLSDECSVFSGRGKPSDNPGGPENTDDLRNFAANDEPDEVPGETPEDALIETETKLLPKPPDNNSSDDDVGQYLKELSRTPLLSAEEEVDLAKRIEKGEKARKKMNRGNIPAKQKNALIGIIEDGETARDHFIRANARLVVKVAKRYVGRGVDFLDLIQEGNLGLMLAVTKYDYHKGNRFSTYGTWWIRQAVTRAIVEKSRSVRLPSHINENIRRMSWTRSRLTNQLGHEPTIDELAGTLEKEPEEVRGWIDVSREILSLDQQAGDNEDATLGDFIEKAYPDDPTFQETTDRSNLRRLLNEVIAEMPTREAQVIKFRFGITDGYRYTLKAVGNKFGVTRERIRQIEAKALARLRHPATKEKLRDYVEG